MKRLIVFSLVIAGFIAMTVFQGVGAPTVTKTLIRNDRYSSVYRVNVTFDNAYRRDGESITIGRDIQYAMVESNGHSTADSLAYMVVIEDSTFANGTLQLRLYRAAAAPGAFIEVPQGRNVSGVTGVRLIVWTER